MSPVAGTKRQTIGVAVANRNGEFTMKPVITAIVRRALAGRIVDMGQLTHSERLELKRAVRHGFLCVGKGGPWPILKTVYAHPGFDFQCDREGEEADLRRAHTMDLARGTDRFFPWVPFRS